MPVAGERPTLPGSRSTSPNAACRRGAQGRADGARARRAADRLGGVDSLIAHEVNQPLTGVITYGDACLRWLDRETPSLDQARSAVEQMISGARLASDVIARTRGLSKKGALERARLDVNQLIAEVIALIRGEINAHRVSLRADLASSLPPVLGDRVQLQQVVMNLMMNGIQALNPVTGRSRDLQIRSREHEKTDTRRGGGFRIGINRRMWADCSTPLHNEAGWRGYGALDLPVDHRAAWWPDMGL